MPLKKLVWDEIPERDRRNNYYDEEAFDEFEKEISELAERLKKEKTAEEFRDWLDRSGRQWVD